ncbi:MAG TPA: hypothetical protein VMF12_14320 [Xanthobacteraceae bacterium]|nr:hypothetical protein [Xanthobacteraceae bacterium]
MAEIVGEDGRAKAWRERDAAIVARAGSCLGELPIALSNSRRACRKHYGDGEE